MTIKTTNVYGAEPVARVARLQIDKYIHNIENYEEDDLVHLVSAAHSNLNNLQILRFVELLKISRQYWIARNNHKVQKI
jgi:beta-mannanase